jgi:pyridoxal phosphate enzyme (YggS family)
MTLETNYESVKKYMDEHKVTLVAISKTKPVEEILDIYNKGQRIFGENKVQELLDKHECLPKDIQWHLVGHLQTNKVKYVAPFVSLIHSVDSFKLLKEINRQGEKCNRVIPVLLQIYIAEEETKFGLSKIECKDLFEYRELPSLKNISIAGLMGIATNTTDINQVRKEFRVLKDLFDELKAKNVFTGSPKAILSMGMSSDYQVAVEEGSNMVRIGSLIFGERVY